MTNTKYVLLLFAVVFAFTSCEKNDNTENIDATEDVTNTDGPTMDFKFKFDPTQERLGNLGESAALPAGNAGQSPDFNGMSAHYIELAQDKYTAVGSGVVLYHAPETSKGGDNAIDFDQAVIKEEGEVFFAISLDEIPAGTYKWLRVSLGYQNYDIDFNVQGTEYRGTLASFVGFNSYISSFKVKDETVNVNDDKKQGYWAFETHNLPAPWNEPVTGSAPTTTVVNPIGLTSPIPAGSCLVTGEFDPPLVVDGTESEIEIIVSLSTNKSFEWKDNNANGEWDSDQNEQVVDMGLRGLKAFVTKE